MTRSITTENFMTDVIQADKTVLVDFWAPWCPPCRQQLPIVDELAASVGERFSVVKVNIDENREIVQMLAIQSIPTLMVFSGGKLATRLVGLQSKATLLNALETASA